MIKENLIAERIAIEHYTSSSAISATEIPGTRVMLERILLVEEEHANDMHDLLVGPRRGGPRSWRGKLRSRSGADAYRGRIARRKGFLERLVQ